MPARYRKYLLLSLLVLTPVIQGCGQKGALYLPEEKQPSQTPEQAL